MKLPGLVLPQPSGFRASTVSDPDLTGALARRIGESPLFEDLVGAVEECRRAHNTVPNVSDGVRNDG